MAINVLTWRRKIVAPPAVPEEIPGAPEEKPIFRSLLATGDGFRVLVGVLGAVIVWGILAWFVQLAYGLEVTGLRDYFFWGVYITNFVFFIGISHAGTLISAILRVTGAEWRRPITRMAEAITLFALLVAAPMVLVDIGRPDRIWELVVYGRIQSPILWDIISVTTYLAGSALYLYVPMIPDLAYLRDTLGARSPWRKRLYSILALGWHGSEKQARFLEKAIGVMALVIIPVAVSVHTVVSWIFSMTLRAGWRSSIFGPYFVIGAIFSGIAAIITAMWIFRRVYHLENYITDRHFKNLGLLLLVFNLIYIYFTFSEYLTMSYVAEGSETYLLEMLFGSAHAPSFWFMIATGLLIPAVLLALPWFRTPNWILVASLLINVGLWLKRYLIVIPTEHNPFLPIQRVPTEWAQYTPTWVEWSITAAAFAGFILMYALFSKVFPIVSLWETREIATDK